MKISEYMTIIRSILIAITFFAIGIDYERGKYFKNKIFFFTKIGDRYSKNDEFGDTEIEVLNINSKNIQYKFTILNGKDVTILLKSFQEDNKGVMGIDFLKRYYYKTN